MNSNKTYRVASLVLVGILVMFVGGLAGWYVVLRQKGQTISFGDAARGFGFGAPSASEAGGTYDNIGSNTGGFAIGGGGIIPGPTDGGIGGVNGGFGGSAGDAGFVDTVIGSSGTSTQSSTSTTGLPGTIVFKTPRLWRITKTPVAGFEFATGTPAIYFAERATGNVMRADIVSGELTRRTNTLTPKVYEAYLARDGTPIYRTINETSEALETFNGLITNASTSANLGSVSGINLKNNLYAFDANPDSKTIFYITEDQGGFTAYTMPWAPGRNGTEREVFRSGIGGWRLFALSDGRLIVSQKPQDGAPGYAYEAKTGGILSPLVRAAPGLTMLPIAGHSAIIFGTSANGSLALFAQTASETLVLPIKTVADKCVWSPYKPAAGRNPATDLVAYCAVPRDASAKNFLQSWYMGALHTSDSWWRVNLTNGKTEQIFTGDVDGAGFDVVDPAIDPSGSILAFKNGVDGTLWVMRIVK
jgi:hypothetical protein